MLTEALKNTMMAALIVLVIYITVDLAYQAIDKEITNRSKTVETGRK